MKYYIFFTQNGHMKLSPFRSYRRSLSNCEWINIEIIPNKTYETKEYWFQLDLNQGQRGREVIPLDEIFPPIDNSVSTMYCKKIKFKK